MRRNPQCHWQQSVMLLQRQQLPLHSWPAQLQDILQMKLA
jgi:hypothetical protein